MTIVHRKGRRGPEALACAQEGCRDCLEGVIEENEGLIHAVMQGIRRGGVPYDELLQEGRIGLWQAVRCFDDARGVAFSTYAWVVVERRIWRAITLAKRPEGQPMGREPGEELEAVLLRVWQCQVSEA